MSRAPFYSPGSEQGSWRLQQATFDSFLGPRDRDPNRIVYWAPVVHRCMVSSKKSNENKTTHSRINPISVIPHRVLQTTVS